MTDTTNEELAEALRSIEGVPLGTRLIVRLAADRLDPRIAMAEACVDPDADVGWIEWGGGECPVPKDGRVDIVTRAGNRVVPDCIARLLYWDHRSGGGDIIRYRAAK